MLPFFTDNPPIVHWDERIGKYVIYTRAFCYDSENQRRIGRIETDDPLKPWPYHKTDNDRMFLSIDNVAVVLSADDEDDPHSDIYYNASSDLSLGAGRLPDVHDASSGISRPSAIRSSARACRASGRTSACSKCSWPSAATACTGRGPSREPYFPTGPGRRMGPLVRGDGPGIVRRGNYLYQYYNSSGRLHDSVVLRPEYDESAKQVGGVGVVRQRLDGFVSADADHQGGWLRTPPSSFRGNRLRLNIDTGAMGTAFVELQDADGPADSRLHAGRLRGDRRQLHRPARLLEGQPRRLLAGRPARAAFTSS